MLNLVYRSKSGANGVWTHFPLSLKRRKIQIKLSLNFLQTYSQNHHITSYFPPLCKVWNKFQSSLSCQGQVSNPTQTFFIPQQDQIARSRFQESLKWVLNPTETFFISQQEHEKGQVLSNFYIIFFPHSNLIDPSAEATGQEQSSGRSLIFGQGWQRPWLWPDFQTQLGKLVEYSTVYDHLQLL